VPYLGGSFLFISNVSDGIVHPYKGGLLLNVTVERSTLPQGWEAYDWTRAFIMVWPAASWVNIRVPVVPLLAKSALDPLFAHFQLHCQHCGPKSPSNGIQPNNRFYFFGSHDFISEEGEWALRGASTAAEMAHRPPEWKYLLVETPSNRSNGVVQPNQQRVLQMLHHGDSGPAEVYIAGLVAPLLHVVGAQHIRFENLGITDSDYRYQGYQASFNVLPTAVGSPADGAIAISESIDVNVTGCNFFALGGGGVLLANRSSQCTVSASTFHDIGQSGVMMVGNATSQPTHCAVLSCNMSRTGAVLSSSAGVFITSGSHHTVRANRIDTVPRWGIAVRSNHGAPSAGTVQHMQYSMYSTAYTVQYIHAIEMIFQPQHFTDPMHTFTLLTQCTLY
jgi:hypothetical protein